MNLFIPKLLHFAALIISVKFSGVYVPVGLIVGFRLYKLGIVLRNKMYGSSPPIWFIYLPIWRTDVPIHVLSLRCKRSPFLG